MAKQRVFWARSSNTINGCVDPERSFYEVVKGAQARGGGASRERMVKISISLSVEDII